MRKKLIAIVGATGVVGRTVLKVLEERSFKDFSYILFSSKKSAGKKMYFLGKNYVVQELKENSFDLNFDYAIFCANSDVAKKYIPIAISKGCLCIDNSSVFRMNTDVPLIVPEVNMKDVYFNKGVIANPNCSTIQAVVAISPLDKAFSIKRLVYSTYQAVSGAGHQGIEDLKNGINGIAQKKFPYPIFNNCLPHIDDFVEDGYTKEEYKLINETRKILHKPYLPITANAVRVPVFNCHCEYINIEFEKDFDLSDVVLLLRNSPNIIVVDDITRNLYPLPTNVNGHDEVFVGRIRRDYSVNSGLNLWVVADNLRKGAASNAIQILENLAKVKRN